MEIDLSLIKSGMLLDDIASALGVTTSMLEIEASSSCELADTIEMSLNHVSSSCHVILRKALKSDSEITSGQLSAAKELLLIVTEQKKRIGR